VPKTGQRVFLNLLRAFGVLGAAGGDELRFPLSGAVSPVVDADDYDPAPLHGFGLSSPLVVGEFSWIELEARPWASVVCLLPLVSLNLRRLSAFTAGGTPVPPATAFHFSSTGEPPNMRVQTGSDVVGLGGISLQAFPGIVSFPPVVPLHFEGVLHLEHISAGLVFAAGGFFREQRAV
jgi:hypothetical protein